MSILYCEKTFVNPDFRHDPDTDGAVVMKAPTRAHAEKFNKKYHDLPKTFVGTNTCILEACLLSRLSLILSLRGIYDLTRLKVAFFGQGVIMILIFRCLLLV